MNEIAQLREMVEELMELLLDPNPEDPYFPETAAKVVARTRAELKAIAKAKEELADGEESG